MPDQKIENLFALALETPLEEREQSENLNVGFQPSDRTWEFIVKYSTDLKDVQEAFPEILTEELIAGYGILTVPENLVRQVLTRTEIEYAEIPKKLFFADFQARAASCILEVTQRYPELTGEGVVVAVIDSGIDYTLPHFRRADGSTRILALWDQSQPASEQYPPPQGFGQGRLYTEEDINRALETINGQGEEEGYGAEMRLSEDVTGHGTAVAGLAAASRLNDYEGAAPDSMLLVVKLANAMQDSFPRTTELMRAVTFAVRFCSERNLPVVINLSFGNSYGSHDGGSILERFMDNAAEIGRSVICVGTGNEGASGGHFSGVIVQGQILQAEFSVASYEASLNLQIWKNYIDTYDVVITAPSGAAFRIQSTADGAFETILGQTKLLIYAGEPKPYTTNQEIYIDFLPQRTYVDSGIWTVSFEPIAIKNGYVYMYLPSQAVRSSGTRFVRSSPEVTMTIPATASKVIAVGAYNSTYNAYADFSGRGYPRQNAEVSEREIGAVRPTLVAPGVSLQVITSQRTYQYVSGTSFATPIVSGAAALMLEWGIVRGEDIFLYGEKVKAELIRGARRLEGIEVWPSSRLGWGALCLAESIRL